MEALTPKERQAKEGRVRQILGREFGVEFSRRRLSNGIEHEFDLVSEDGKIVGEVKTSEPNKRAMKHNLRTAQLGDFARDCLLLLIPKAETRLFVLTNKEVYDRFIITQYGKAAKELGIDIRYVRA